MEYFGASELRDDGACSVCPFDFDTVPWIVNEECEEAEAEGASRWLLWTNLAAVEGPEQATFLRAHGVQVGQF